MQPRYPSTEDQRTMTPPSRQPPPGGLMSNGAPQPNGMSKSDTSSSMATGTGPGKQPTRPGSSGGSFWSRRTLHGANVFPRRGFSTALKDQSVFWFGGKSENGLHNDLYKMDAASWEVAPVSAEGMVPKPREGHSASFIGRTMFLFGGELEDGTYDQGLHVYNMPKNMWFWVNLKGRALQGRKGHTAISVGCKLFVFGGTAKGVFFNDLVSFDVRAAENPKNGAQWSFDEPNDLNSTTRMSHPPRHDFAHVAPPGRAGHSCSRYGGSLYVFGGMDNQQCFNDLWAYDLELKRWTQVTPHGATPPARYGHASAVVEDCLFIMGGRTQRGEPLNDFFAYKITSQRWYTFQVSAASWPHQIDPVFSVVKTRLLLYSGSMPREAPGSDALIYSLDTSKIKIQSDAGNARGDSNTAGGIKTATSMPPPPPPPSTSQHQSSLAIDKQREASQESEDKARRHRSLMPPPSYSQSPQHPQSVSPSQQKPPVPRAISMVAEGGMPIQKTGTLQSEDSFEMISPVSPPMAGNSRNANNQPNANSIAASATTATANHQEGTVEPLSPPPSMAANDISESSSESIAFSQDPRPPQQQDQQQLSQRRDDRRLTIQLRNRNSVAIQGQVNMGDADNHEPLPTKTTPSDSQPKATETQEGLDSHVDATSEWKTLEARYATSRVATEDGKPEEVSGRVLDVLLAMRRELADAKQQLATVSRVSMERVAEAERGRKAALQEAIYLKAKTAALTAGHPQLLAKLGTHRSHELERACANAMNDCSALRNQLTAANLTLKQAHAALAEAKSDSDVTRKQLRDMEDMHGAADSDATDRLAEKDRALEALREAEEARTERLEAALNAATTAADRADRLQSQYDETLEKVDELSTRVSDLTAEQDRQKSLTARAEERAARFEKLWNETKKELAGAQSMRVHVEKLESRERTIADLERRLSDAHIAVDNSNGSGPRSNSVLSDSSINGVLRPATGHRASELHTAYLSTHRKWSDARDELLSIKSTLRDAGDSRREAEAKLANRERELAELQARMAAFTTLLKEYSEQQIQTDTLKSVDRAKQQPPDSLNSVTAMLAAIQQLQHNSSVALDSSKET